ncbi:hypothetical protein [Actinokineospora terrae]|uniref:hypothetical protein n=1 Tax=Actinokineospora terrae TaxID=155974 RepID=UPI000B87E2ED|nr:hypothetical protein [Actinokineospora terrae]
MSIGRVSAIFVSLALMLVVGGTSAAATTPGLAFVTQSVSSAVPEPECFLCVKDGGRMYCQQIPCQF